MLLAFGIIGKILLSAFHFTANVNMPQFLLFTTFISIFTCTSSVRSGKWKENWGFIGTFCQHSLSTTIVVNATFNKASKNSTITLTILWGKIVCPPCLTIFFKKAHLIYEILYMHMGSVFCSILEKEKKKIFLVEKRKRRFQRHKFLSAFVYCQKNVDGIFL